MWLSQKDTQLCTFFLAVHTLPLTWNVCTLSETTLKWFIYNSPGPHSQKDLRSFPRARSRGCSKSSASWRWNIILLLFESFQLPRKLLTTVHDCHQPNRLTRADTHNWPIYAHRLPNSCNNSRLHYADRWTLKVYHNNLWKKETPTAVFCFCFCFFSSA